MDVEGVKFADCVQRKKTVEVDETFIDFLGIDDLIAMKKRAGRFQDLADAENLEKIKNNRKSDRF